MREATASTHGQRTTFFEGFTYPSGTIVPTEAFSARDFKPLTACGEVCLFRTVLWFVNKDYGYNAASMPRNATDDNSVKQAGLEAGRQ